MTTPPLPHRTNGAVAPTKAAAKPERQADSGAGTAAPAVRARADQPASDPPAGSTRRPRPQRRRGIRTTLAGALLAAMLAGALGLRYGVPHAAEGIVLAEAPLVFDISGPGTLTAIESSTAGARIQGMITALHADRSDRVRKGDPLADIAADDLKSNLAAATASRDAARRAVDLAEADRERAEAGLRNARLSHDRQRDLLRQGTTSQASYDTALATLQQAEADVARTEAAVSQARAQAISAEATVALNRTRLEDAVVRAPFDGIVVSRDRNLGDVVTPGTSLFSIVDPASLVLTARFDESTMAEIRPGQQASLSFASAPDRRVAAHVHRLGRTVDEETREFTVDVKPDRLPDTWAIGQRGTARVAVGAAARTLSIPTDAIVHDDGRPGLWFVVNGRAWWRPVTFGRIGDGRAEIRSGGAPGDTVLLKPAGAYRGMRVDRAETAR
ncbi:efflux RND transporter periplasmic adaptor subunit [Rhizobium sp. TRM95111]|uniref:efflux RND transporter periplasmic adaptor subunit n=1 Tax=Rhizobium alarense TaxID=2846851 RepID=UPI001F2C303C|nr:efflux RND transporter periplasmic adaptor subunit [Rhizobium alarense]MCF3641285.1 efflux RND transporter periplasmic adaptor subunit [Rhizobium alarense]